MNEQPDVTRHVALIPAAGVGARMAAGSPKQYLPIGAKPMLPQYRKALTLTDKGEPAAILR